jgi:hypothetical protein
VIRQDVVFEDVGMRRALIDFKCTWIFTVVANKIFFVLKLTCDSKGMAGGVGTVTRQMRNTFRGVKKDMLQKQTTLYLQNMTVSIVNRYFICSG